MGNISGRKDETDPSGTKNTEESEEKEEDDEEEEEYMEYAQVGAQGPFPESTVHSPPHSPRVYPSPLIFTPQVPVVPLQGSDEIMQIQSNRLIQNAAQKEDMLSGVPTTIMWSHDGKQVAVEGSWDQWKTRAFLQKSGKDFTIMKVLPSGVYHYLFIVDGQWRYSPDLPHEHDNFGNIFNVLDLQDYAPEVLNNISEPESPSSPLSSYNNSPFTLEDFNQKLPELPPLLQQSPLDQPSSSSRDSPETLEKPLAAGLNHLYIQKGHTGQSLVALSSSYRFRSKYVTAVLYKPVKKVKK